MMVPYSMVTLETFKEDYYTIVLDYSYTFGYTDDNAKFSDTVCRLWGDKQYYKPYEVLSALDLIVLNMKCSLIPRVTVDVDGADVHGFRVPF